MSELEALLRIVVAAALGGVLGFEREVSAKPAGLRTHILVAKGSALFMVGSMLITEDAEFGNITVIDPTRIGSTIVTGVGFLGAGMILRSGDRIQGLTTAAGIWVAAAIGMLVGAGYFLVPIFATLLGLFINVGLRLFQRRYVRPRLASLSSKKETTDQDWPGTQPS